MFLLAFCILSRCCRCSLCLKPWTEIELSLLSEQNPNFTLFSNRHIQRPTRQLSSSDVSTAESLLFSRCGILWHWACSYWLPSVRSHTFGGLRPTRTRAPMAARRMVGQDACAQGPQRLGSWGLSGCTSGGDGSQASGEKDPCQGSRTAREPRGGRWSLDLWSPCSTDYKVTNVVVLTLGLKKIN